MNWKEILKQDEEARKKAEKQAREQVPSSNTREPLLRPREFSSSELMSFVGAKELLEGIRRDVWKVGEIVPGVVYYDPDSLKKGYCLALVYTYPILEYKFDSKEYPQKGSDHTSTYTYNHRMVLVGAHKILAVGITDNFKEYDDYLFVFTSGCVSGSYYPVVKVRPGTENPYSYKTEDWKDKPVKELLTEKLKTVVTNCNAKGDLPLQRKVRAEVAIKAGGKHVQGSWVPYKGEGGFSGSLITNFFSPI